MATNDGKILKGQTKTEFKLQPVEYKSGNINTEQISY